MNAKLFEHPVSFGPQKAHREKNKVGIDGELAAGDFTHIASFELNTNAVKLFDKSVSASEFFSKDAVVAIAALFVCRRRTEDIRPVRPRIIHSPVRRGFGKNFKLDNGTAALAVDCAETVGTRIAAADDHNALVFC